jgi:FkbM family methyltransferase
MSEGISRFGKKTLSRLVATGFGSRVTAFATRSLKTNSCVVRHGGLSLVFAYSFPGVRYRVDTFATKEPETLEWIDTFPSGSNFVDVGANIGLYSVYAARRGARVLAIEPGPENIFTLIMNVQLNDLSKTVCLYFNAIGHEDGKVVALQQGTVDPGGARLSAFQPSEEAALTWMSPIRTLDSVCTEQDFWPDFIKVDIDGNEHEFLLGAEQAIRCAKEIQLETDVGNPEYEHLITRLESFGHHSVRRTLAQPGSSTYNLVFKNLRWRDRNE